MRELPVAGRLAYLLQKGFAETMREARRWLAADREDRREFPPAMAAGILISNGPLFRSAGLAVLDIVALIVAAVYFAGYFIDGHWAFSVNS